MRQKPKMFKLAFIASGIIVLSIMAFQFQPNNPVNYEPILMSRTDMEASVKLGEARAIISPGKIWIFNDVIFLIEQYKGIHVIDNSNPSVTKTVAFIQIDGCTDITMKGDIIYANNAVDMIGIKGNNDLSGIEVISRNRNMLPEIASPEPWGDWYFYDKLPQNTIIVRWVPYQD